MVRIELQDFERARSTTPTGRRSESVIFSESASEINESEYGPSDDELESVTDSHALSEADTEATNDIFSEPDEEWEHPEDPLWETFVQPSVNSDDMRRQAAQALSNDTAPDADDIGEERHREASWRQKGWDYLKLCRDACMDGAASAASALSIMEMKELLTNVPDLPIDFVAVVGLTGHGKSTFVKSATMKDVRISHGLEPGTREYGMYPTFINRRLHILIDFPGFNSDNMTDFQVFQKMYDWFHFLNEARIKLKAVLFLYDIGHKRGTSGDRLCFDVLKAACGKDALPNLVLVMTNWDKQERLGSVEHAKVLEREIAELYWGDALRYGKHGESFRFRGASETQGAKEYHWKRARKSARGILRELDSNRKIQLAIQKEIAASLRAEETTAWKLLFKERGAGGALPGEKAVNTNVPKPSLPLDRIQLSIGDRPAGKSKKGDGSEPKEGTNFHRFFSYFLDALSRIFKFSWRRPS